jgi:hypothetical protein
MKKYFFILPFIFLFAVVTHAQQTAIGFNAGATLATYKMKSSDESATSNLKVGFTTGFVIDIPVGKKASFQPEIQFTQKGGISKEPVEENNNRKTTTFNYLEIPLNMLYKIGSPKSRFYIGGGPSVAFGISGKSKDEVSEYPITFGKSNSGEFKRLDLGLNLLAGYHFGNGIFISFNYNFGLNNLVIGGDSNNSFKNKYFGLRLGYMQGKKKLL